MVTAKSSQPGGKRVTTQRSAASPGTIARTPKRPHPALEPRSPLTSPVALPRPTGIGYGQDGPFDAQSFLDSEGIPLQTVEYGRGDVIFSQGDPCDRVFYIRSGGVRISVLSKTGKQAVVATLGPGDFFGDGGLAGQPVRMGTAIATTQSSIRFVDQFEMVRLLRRQHAMSDQFIAHLLARTIQIEEDLVDQLFSTSERRLARRLLLLARYGEHVNGVRTAPTISQETLAEMVGTTRSRVNFFMKKFERLGFIDYDDGLRVHDSLATIVLHDSERKTPPSSGGRRG